MKIQRIRIRAAFRFAFIETENCLRSTKIAAFALFVIFINIQVISVLRSLSSLMQSRLTAIEPFIGMCNSGFVMLVFPLLYMVLVADIPENGRIGYFYHIRTDRKSWIAGEIIYIIISSIVLILATLILSVLLSADFIRPGTDDFSYAVTNYLTVFPDRTGDYVATLIPANLYNQSTPLKALIYSSVTLMMYFWMTGLILLLSAIMGSKLTGLIIDIIIFITGTVSYNMNVAFKWIFPAAHCCLPMHFREYLKKPVMPVYVSFMYFGIIDVGLVFLCLVLCRKYQEW